MVPDYYELLKEKADFEAKTQFLSLETMSIVFRSKFYMIYFGTSRGDRIPLSKLVCKDPFKQACMQVSGSGSNQVHRLIVLSAQ